LNDELALDQRLEHIELRLFQPLVEFVAGEGLAQRLLGLPHLVVDLDVSDDLVVDHRGDAVGQELGAGGRRECK
jgi:hypothetical protein